MVDTFTRMLGVYFHFNGEPVPELVKTWNVKRLVISREGRHLDLTIALKFFQHLDVGWRLPSVLLRGTGLLGCCVLGCLGAAARPRRARCRRRRRTSSAARSCG
jgi:hypothetical protein